MGANVMAFVAAPLLRRRRGAAQRGWRCGTDADVVVVGGGVGGLAAARALQRAGRAVTVYERGVADAPAGQAVGLWTNAWRALDALRVDTGELRANARNTSATIVRARDGARLAAVGLPAATEFRYVEREQLVHALRDEAVPVHYGAPVESVVLKKGVAVISLAGGEVVRARMVIGADGVRSVVRAGLGLANTVRNAPYRAWRGSAEAGAGQMRGLGEGQILQAWGVGERVGVTRVRDGLIHWFYTGVKDGEFGTDEEELEFVRRRVSGWGCAEAVEVTRLPQRAFTVTRCGDRLMWAPQFGRGAVTLVGDAAHLSTPNLGQGAALALEDAVEIAHQLSIATDDAKALRAYERARWARNLSIGVRSAAAGVVAHLSAPPLVAVRDSVVVPIVLSEKVLLSSTDWKAPSF